MRKQEFATAVRARISQFDDLVSKMIELDDIYTASEYNLGGSNEITVEDLENLDMAPTDLANISYFVEQIKLFLNNGDPAQVDYASHINRLRSMP